MMMKLYQQLRTYFRTSVCQSEDLSQTLIREEQGSARRIPHVDFTP